MVSGWHMAHLPVRVAGSERRWHIIDEVVVSWEEFRLSGFLMAPRPFFVGFLPAHTPDLAVTPTGIEVRSRSVVQRCPRGWRRAVVKEQRRAKNRAVVDQWGRLQGRMKDFMFDERSLAVTYLVVSRGIVGDLISGALMVAVDQVTEVQDQVIKIIVPGEPFSM